MHLQVRGWPAHAPAPPPRALPCLLPSPLAHLDLARELEEHAPVHDLAARGERVVGVEGRVAHDHLKHDGAQGPAWAGGGQGCQAWVWRARVCLSVCLCVHAYVHAYMRAYVRVCVCVHTCVCVLGLRV